MPRARLLERIGADGDERMAAAFARAGLVFSPSPTMPNSLAALRLAELARERGLHAPLHERLMESYWGEGVDIGGLDALRALAAEVGLDEPETAWADDGYREIVRSSTRQAQALGVTGIPGFLLDRRLLVLGAQPDEVFVEAFAQLG